MLYVELYLCDYLKKHQDRAESLELWGKSKGKDFYVCHLRGAAEQKPFYRPHMEYLGDFLKLEKTKNGAAKLYYLRNGQEERRQTVSYISKETEDIERFLISQKGLQGGAPKKAPERKQEEKPEIEPRIEAKERKSAALIQAAVFLLLIFLAANMAVSLDSYQNIEDVLGVVKLLWK